VPIDERAREGADEGRPIVLEDEEAPISQALLRVADEVVKLTAGE